jgi:GT2 family glycosyltransferase
MKFYIVILNWNGSKDTLACLKSLEEQTDQDFHLLLVDNASTDGSYEKICPLFPKVEWIINSQNEGFAKGNNIAIKKALEKGADLILLLNNDTVAAPDMVEKFKKGHLLYPDALISGKIINFFNPKILDHLGGNYNIKKSNFDLLGHLEDEKDFQEAIFNLDYLCGCALMVPKAVFEKIGFLDEDFFLYFEDADFSIRAKKAAFRLAVFPEAQVFHKVSQSSKGKFHQAYFFWRNRLLFLKKHGHYLDRNQLFKKILAKEIWKILRHTIAKRIQYFVSNQKKKEELKVKIATLRAALMGIKDYADKRFGPPPAKLFKK